MSVTTLLFDLDGTLLEAHPGILNSIAHTLETLLLPVPSQRELHKVSWATYS
ncbi:MAG: hypothetical protein ACRCYY_04345 [Trueperaceae bacterium]